MPPTRRPMLKIGPFTFYWPGERGLRARMEEGDRQRRLAYHDLAEAKAQHAADVARLTAAVLKAKGIYAGPFLAYQGADGTGLAFPDEKVFGYRVTLTQDSHRGLRGRIELEATVEVVGIDLYALMEARHVEWQGVKWKAGPARLEREYDIEHLGGSARGWNKVEVPLQAFIEHVNPKDIV